VVTTVLLDRELQSSYELLITCTDAVGTNSTSLTGSAQLSVVVDDVNDHAPVFRSRVFLAHMAENQPIGTSVAVIEAIDRDDGHNADVRYRLLSDFRGDFRLDIRSGLLTTNRGFDREREEVVNITVVAMDLGNPSLSSTANVVVSILDEDDEVKPYAHIVIHELTLFSNLLYLYTFSLFELFICIFNKLIYFGAFTLFIGSM